MLSTKPSASLASEIGFSENEPEDPVSVAWYKRIYGEDPPKREIQRRAPHIIASITNEGGKPFHLASNPTYVVFGNDHEHRRTQPVYCALGTFIHVIQPGEKHEVWSPMLVYDCPIRDPKWIQLGFTLRQSDLSDKHPYQSWLIRFGFYTTVVWTDKIPLPAPTASTYFGP